MRKTGRFLLWSLIAIALTVLAGALIARPITEEAGAEPHSRTILLISNPIHTDIALRLDEDVRRKFNFLIDGGTPINADAAQWLIIGWGGRAFYLETPTWAALKPLPVLKALTVDNSVMHVDVAGAVDLAHPAIMPLNISDFGYERLLEAMLHSFTEVDGKRLPIRGAAYGSNDAFFEAEGSFNLLLGCNLWSSRMLQEAGLRVGWWTPLPATLRWSLDALNEPR